MSFDGVVIIDKPVGLTSHDAVEQVKRSLGAAKVGHTGTLDPFATGVLVMGVNQGTKLIPFLDKTEKVYRGVIVLGATTDTYDCTGKVVETRSIDGVDEGDVRRVMSRFLGDTLQRPPLYSALKVDGVRLYKLARSGRATVRPQPRTVRIRSVELIDFSPPRVTFEVICSPGTYIRSLATDIGDALGVGAYLEELRRTASGPFTIETAYPLFEFVALGASGYRAVIGLREAISDIREVPISQKEAGLVAKGGFLSSREVKETRPGATVKLVHDGRLVALAQVLDQDTKANLKPLRVFV